MDVDVVAVVNLRAELEEVLDVHDGAPLQPRVWEERGNSHLHVAPTSASQVEDVEDVDAFVEGLSEHDLLVLAVLRAVRALQDDGSLDKSDAPWAPVGYLRVDVDDLPWNGGASTDATLQLDLKENEVEIWMKMMI